MFSNLTMRCPDCGGYRYRPGRLNEEQQAAYDEAASVLGPNLEVLICRECSSVGFRAVSL
jgi:hypothetical protein